MVEQGVSFDWRGTGQFTKSMTILKLRMTSPVGSDAAAKSGLPNGVREDVVEIEVHLPDHPNIVAARTIDGNDRLDAQLVLVAHINQTGIDRASSARPPSKLVVCVARSTSTIGIRWLMTSGNLRSITLDLRYGMLYCSVPPQVRN